MLEIWQIAGAGMGAFVIGLGLFLLRFRQTRGVPEADATQAGSSPSSGLSTPTRLSLGLCLMALGYHAVAYSLPSSWIYLKVPVDRLWVLAVCSGVLVGGSLLTDRLLSR